MSFMQELEQRVKTDLALAATGIEDRLKAAGKKYFALSPRRAADGKTLTFLLNPYDQQFNNFGWFTLKDLEDWIEDKGPIPMTAEQRKKHSR